MFCSKAENIRDLVMKLAKKRDRNKTFFWLTFATALPEVFKNLENNLNTSVKLGNDGLYIPISAHTLIQVNREKLYLNLLHLIKQFS